MFNPLRIKKVNELEINEEKRYAYYWMQASQRIEDNFALEYLLCLCEQHNKKPVIFFCLAKNYGLANRRHYYFMIQGILEIKEKLDRLGIEFKIVAGSPKTVAASLSECSLVVMDKGYTRIQRTWREEVACVIETALYEVEDNVVVPVETASIKEEYGAYTIRKKLWDKKSYFCGENFSISDIKKYNLNETKTYINGEIEIYDIEEILSDLNVDNSVRESFTYLGGENEALRRMEEFIDGKIKKYGEEGNLPGLSNESKLSPYLHFGNISPLTILREVEKVEFSKEFTEQLFIRRELAINYVWYNENYDNFKGIGMNWVYETLNQHREDKREYLYNIDELEKHTTHDKYWNAAQEEMYCTGKMNGYMRMYWGKKIIEWSKTPEEAMERMIYLNDKYSLDGRDPNGYAGIAWCLGKHDRAWTERAIFGKVRYMNSAGLERKFDMDKYIKNVEESKKMSNNIR